MCYMTVFRMSDLPLDGDPPCTGDPPCIRMYLLVYSLSHSVSTVVDRGSDNTKANLLRTAWHGPGLDFACIYVLSYHASIAASRIGCQFDCYDWSIHIYIHTYIHTYMHTYIHTCILYRQGKGRQGKAWWRESFGCIRTYLAILYLSYPRNRHLDRA